MLQVGARCWLALLLAACMFGRKDKEAAALQAGWAGGRSVPQAWFHACWADGWRQWCSASRRCCSRACCGTHSRRLPTPHPPPTPACCVPGGGGGGSARAHAVAHHAPRLQVLLSQARRLGRAQRRHHGPLRVHGRSGRLPQQRAAGQLDGRLARSLLPGPVCHLSPDQRHVHGLRHAGARPTAWCWAAPAVPARRCCCCCRRRCCCCCCCRRRCCCCCCCCRRRCCCCCCCRRCCCCRSRPAPQQAPSSPARPQPLPPPRPAERAQLWRPAPGRPALCLAHRHPPRRVRGGARGGAHCALRARRVSLLHCSQASPPSAPHAPIERGAPSAGLALGSFDAGANRARP